MNREELSRLNDVVCGKVSSDEAFMIRKEMVGAASMLDAERKLSALKDILLAAAPCANEAPKSLGLADRVMEKLLKPVPRAKPVSELWRTSLRAMSAAALLMALFALHYNSALQAIEIYYARDIQKSDLQTLASAIRLSPGWNEGRYPSEVRNDLLLKIFNQKCGVLGARIFSSELNNSSFGFEATPISINALLERKLLPAQIPIVWERSVTPGANVDVAFLDGKTQKMTDAEIARLVFVLQRITSAEKN